MLPVLTPLAGEPMLLGEEAATLGALAALGCLGGLAWTAFWPRSCSGPGEDGTGGNGGGARAVPAVLSIAKCVNTWKGSFLAAGSSATGSAAVLGSWKKRSCSGTSWS